jgi:MFS family permease
VLNAGAGFPRVLAAEAASNFGSMLSRLAIPWLATLVLDASAWQMALLVVVDVLAGAVGSLLLGAWVDRHGKRGAMLAADALRAALLLLLAAAAATQQLTMALLLLASAAGAWLTVVFELARSAWMAQQLVAASLSDHNAKLAMATGVSEAAAFALGGWLYQWWGALVALIIDAASYVVSALCLRGLQETPVAMAASGSGWGGVWRDIREGLATLWANPTARGLALLEALSAMARGAAGTSYMIFVARDIGMPTGVIGMAAATGALGALLGAAVAARLGRRFGTARTMALGLALAGIGSACVAAVPGWGWLGVTLLIAQQVIGDSGQVVYEVHDRTLRQQAVASRWLARVDAGIRTAGQTAMLIGALLGAALATAQGARAALVLTAALLGVAALCALSLRR